MAEGLDGNGRGWSGTAERPLAGRVALITGGGRGIGRDIALAHARAGARVAVFGRSRAPLDETVDEIADSAGDAVALVGSVTDEARVEAAVGEVVDGWGRLDIVVNNAGISPHMRRSEDVTLHDWQQVIDVNLTGAFLCARHGARHMLDRGGSIVNVSSVHGVVGAPRLAAYTASKGALEMLTRTLALEWAERGIRVNGVAPGYLATDMTDSLRNDPSASKGLLANIPLERFGTGHDVAPAVVFLSSDAASYITGATLPIDGGWTAR